jgi:iron complex transport system substrate-binding protein
VSVRTVFLALAVAAAAVLLVWQPFEPEAQDAARDEAPQRVVTMAPSITDLVFAMGCGERVVGVTDFCDYPSAVETLPRLGGIQPNVEALLALRPDLVLTLGEADTLRRLCKSRGIELVRLRIEDLKTLFASIHAIGDRLGASQAAAKLVGDLHAELDQLQQTAAQRPPQKVFLCIGRASGDVRRLTTVGAGTFLDDVLQLLGAQNAFGDLGQRYGQVSLEALVARAPDVIIELRPDDPDDPDHRRRLRQEWNVLSTVPAVQNGRVCVLTEDYLLKSGSRIVATAKRLNRCLDEDVSQSNSGRLREETSVD